LPSFFVVLRGLKVAERRYLWFAEVFLPASISDVQESSKYSQYTIVIIPRHRLHTALDSVEHVPMIWCSSVLLLHLH
jgi:hypothetical protein